MSSKTDFQMMRIDDNDILLTDSRSLTDSKRSVFFALRTLMGDGHRFVKQLYDKGVRRFVVDAEFDTTPFPGAEFEVVENPLERLQQLATEKRSRANAEIIGVTGSRGKTLVKEWLSMLLAEDGKVCRSPRSYNSQIGVPLSVWGLTSTDRYGVFEAGISAMGEMARLNAMISPDIAVVTNITSDHAAGFSSRGDKIREKLQIMKGARLLILPAADSELVEIAKRLAEPSTRFFSWSVDPDIPAQVMAKFHNLDDKTRIVWRCADSRRGMFTVPFVKPWQLENVMTVLSVLLAMGYPASEADRRIELLKDISTRISVTKGVNDCMIVSDDYPADLPSLELALDFVARRQTTGRTLTVILSDLATDGENEAEVYRRAATILRRRGVSRLIGIGNGMVNHFPTMNIPGCSYPTVERFLESTTPTDFSHELILVEGTPGDDFPKITHSLEAKTHETVLEVNLDAMVDNFNFFRSKLHPQTGIVAMVKASGYGAGSLELGKTLQAHGAAYLAVAVGDEGEELRQAGIRMPIMVLNPMVLNYKQLFDNRLEPEIFSFESLASVIREAQRAGVTDFPIHIKIDSGMHRLGFREEELPRLFEILDNQNQVKVRSVFSHLATADCLDQNAYTLGQLEYYSRCAAKIVEHFPYKVLRHVLNTAGILRFPEYQFDMVRLGIGLYGIPVVNDGSEAPLRPISTLRSVIIAIRDWTPEETIGYGRHGHLNRPSRIATVPIGYADGFNRHCGRGEWKVLVNGVPCPTVGNICMDLCMIDITDVPSASIGDPVVIFGPEAPATPMAMAEVLDTIPYECLTSVSPRVPRAYYRES